MRIISRRLASLALGLLLIASAAVGARTAPDAVIIFAPDAGRLKEADMSILDQVSAKAKADSAVWIALEAYASDKGSHEMNLALAQRRIDSIIKGLAVLGFPAHRISGTSYVEERAIDDELPMRRVEIRIEKFGI